MMLPSRIYLFYHQARVSSWVEITRREGLYIYIYIYSKQCGDDGEAIAPCSTPFPIVPKTWGSDVSYV